MARECRTFDLPADVGLEALADTPGELMEALAEGLADMICPRGQVRPRQVRRLSVRAEDREALAVDFLTRVMVTIQTERFLVSAVRVAASDGVSVTADLSGEPFDPERHAYHIEVKAVTYHLLKFAPEGGRWAGRVVLDL